MALLKSSYTSHVSNPTHLEAFLKVLVLLEELRIIDNGLRVGDLELHDLVVHRLGRFDGTDRFFQVDVKGPQFERLEKTGLYRNVLEYRKRRTFSG